MRLYHHAISVPPRGLPNSLLYSCLVRNPLTLSSSSLQPNDTDNWYLSCKSMSAPMLSCQLNESDEDESNPRPHTKPTILDTFSSMTIDSKLPKREYITCQLSTVAGEAVSGESLHKSETTCTPDTLALNSHVHTHHPRLRMKPAYLKDYIVGL